MLQPDAFPAQCYANREISWLRFNRRVLEEAEDTANPLMERLNFLSIFQSNLDEFFMVRVGMLMDTPGLGVTDDKLGLTSLQQLDAVIEETKTLLTMRDRLYKSLLRELSLSGVEICKFSSLPDKAQSLLEKYFRTNIQPLLSPQLIGRKQPFPFLRNKEIYAVATLKNKAGKESFAIVPCEEAVLPRLTPVPGTDNCYILTEELILGLISKLFPKFKIDECTLIRLVRSADIDMDDPVSDSDGMLPDEYRKQMEKLIRRRKKLSPVKLEHKGKLSDEFRTSLCKMLNLNKKQCFQSASSLDLSFCSLLRDKLRDNADLFYPRRVPQSSVLVSESTPMVEQIRKRDILLSYPYESVRPLLRLLQEAGNDPEVVSIKISLYRVAKNSKIVEALVDAAENGKDVCVVVELKARFDEENNIGWSRVLEEAGCRVVYGLDGMKVHAKLLLITRMHGGEVEYISHIGTGNYNEDTVRVYSDLALMTANPWIGAEVGEVLNNLSMGELVDHTESLLVSPQCLRTKIIAMIEEETVRAEAGEEAYLGFKLNGITDKVIIDKLITASRAGVHIDLLVRGICCIVAGVPGYTDNIKVYSIVGRYLEHSRIYIFGTGERRKVYISSADFMTRNTTRRVETAAPILDSEHKKRVEDIFFTHLKDTAKLRRQQSDGTYISIKSAGVVGFNSQEHFSSLAYENAAKKAEEQTPATGEKPEGFVVRLKKMFGI